MTKFSSGSAIREIIKGQIASNSRVDCAVAFWGRGASELFTARPSTHVRIICDLMSGACNPSVIREMLNIGVHIKSIDGMHAKVYWTPNGVIIGSANASANGLGEEGTEESFGNNEAGIYTEDRTVLKDTSDWFTEQWSKGTLVDELLLRVADELWKRRRANRPVRPNNLSLLGTLRENPEWFRERPIRLVVYEGVEISKHAQDTWDNVKRNLYDADSLEKYRYEIPLYEDFTRWNITKGEYVLDYSISFHGLWRVRSENAFIKLGRNHRLILLDKMDTPPFGLRFPHQERVELGGAIRRFLNKNGKVHDKNSNYIDLPLNEAASLLFH